MKIAAIGECMLELSPSHHQQFSLGFGGDTLNTAIYAARSGAQVDYFTALGDDPFSTQLLEAWSLEGVGVEHVYREPNGQPGLYMIQTDAEGERSFFYWRSDAPAKRLFDNKPELFERFNDYDMLYLSGITLSLYSQTCVHALFAALDKFRTQGGKVVFDINYRPRNWPSETYALSCIEAMLARTDIALPSFDDEQLLYGPHSAEACIDRYQNAGAKEVVVKQGVAGCLVLADGKRSHIPVIKQVAPIDTTAAGDSFNGAYLAARLAGKDIHNAVAAGQTCAATVIQHRGAIIDRQYYPGAGA